MASDKQRRKNSRQARKQPGNPAVPFRHQDGDRRRRGGPNVDQAIADKQALRQFEAELLLPPEPEAE